jgi:hypothetical protein
MSSRNEHYASNFLINGRPYRCLSYQYPNDDFYTVRLIGCRVGPSDISLKILIEILGNEYSLILNTSLSEEDILEDLMEISEEDIIVFEENVNLDSNFIFKSKTSNFYTEFEGRGGGIKPVHYNLR